MTRRQHTWCALGLVALLGLLYGPHIARAEFVYEDAKWLAVSGQAVTLGPRLWPRLAWHAFQSPVALHGLSVALFALTGALVGLLASRLGLSARASWWAAGAFLLAPVMTETAAYAGSLPELFAAIGVLSACILSTVEARWRWPAVLAAIAFGALGKETAIVAVGLVPLTRWASGRWTLERACLVIALVGLLALRIIGQHVVDLVNIGQWAGFHPTVPAWVLMQAAAAWRLVLVSLSGVGMTIDPDIDLISQTARVGALLAIIGLGLGAYRLRQTHRLAAFGLAWMLLAVTPRFLVQTPRGYLNQHQWTVPYIGLVLAGASVVKSA